MLAQIAILSLAVSVVSSASVVYTNPTQAQLDANDILVLRYAATLENFEAAFYNKYDPMFTVDNYTAAGYDGNVKAALGLIRSHENAHAQYLNAVLGAYNSSFVVPMCGSYNFPNITNVTQYLAYAAVFESVGASAYAGAADEIYNSSLLTAAATIATIEARHSGFLNGLFGMAIPQTGYEYALDAMTVGGIIANFIVNCPYNIAAQYPQAFQVIPVITNTTISNPSSYQLAQNDIAALNYALFLENLESAFYRYGMAKFNNTNFNNAGYNGSVYTNFALISAHEDSHVQVLSSEVSYLQGTPIPACNYDFSSVQTVAQFVATAQLLENTGVEAYDGALPTIYDNTLKTLAATIALIEAQHAAYLNKIVQPNSYQGYVSRDAQGSAYDKATAPADIYTAVQATGLLGSCSVIPALPQVYRVYPANNGTNPTTATTSARATTTTTSRATTGTSSTRAATTSSTSKKATTSTTNAPAGSSASMGAVASFVILAASIIAALA